MANLTITVDDDVLREARLRALKQGTSVNALLRDYLTAYAGADGGRKVLREFVAIARKSRSGSGPRGRTWKREEIYER